MTRNKILFWCFVLYCVPSLVSTVLVSCYCFFARTYHLTISEIFVKMFSSIIHLVLLCRAQNMSSGGNAS